MADERGVDELTMRQLAGRLGVRAMALYRHVSSREALLDAMVAALLDQLAATMISRTSSQTSHSTYLTDTAYDVRSLALAHPWLIRLMVLRPSPTGWLSRPLFSLACTDTFLDALHRRGFDAASSVGTYRRFNAFLLAHLLLESAAATPNAAAAARRREPPAAAPLTRYPVLADHRELLAIPDYPAEFGQTLHLFVRAAGPYRTVGPERTGTADARPSSTPTSSTPTASTVLQQGA